MTIAQRLKIKDFPFTIKDKNGKEIYYEDSDGVWTKREYDANGNPIRYEDSHGDWGKYEYDSNGEEIYYENSVGDIRDNQPTRTMNTPTPRNTALIDFLNTIRGKTYGENLTIDTGRLLAWFEAAFSLERKLTAAREELKAVTEQRDAALKQTIYCNADRIAKIHTEDNLAKVTEQRDRLAEALRKAISWGDSASHHILHRQNINWTYLNQAKEALQSLTPKTSESI